MNFDRLHCKNISVRFTGNLFCPVCVPVTFEGYPLHLKKQVCQLVLLNMADTMS